MTTLVASLALFAASALQAQEVNVQGTDAAGRPGERVFVGLSYNYGDSFEVLIEDFQLRYPNAVLSFLRADSTVSILSPTDVAQGGSGISQTLPEYVDTLRSIASSLGGNVRDSDNPAPPAGVLGEYNISFFADGSEGGHVRSGRVDMRLAFDIHGDAAPGDYGLSFDRISNLIDVDETEFRYPSSLQSLKVTVQAAVVPEPEMALMLLPGLALIGMQVRRRRARQAEPA